MDRGEVQVAIVIPEGTQARLESGEIAPVGIVVDGSDSRTAAVSSGTPPRSWPGSTRIGLSSRVWRCQVRD